MENYLPKASSMYFVSRGDIIFGILVWTYIRCYNMPPRCTETCREEKD